MLSRVANQNLEKLPALQTNVACLGGVDSRHSLSELAALGQQCRASLAVYSSASPCGKVDMIIWSPLSHQEALVLVKVNYLLER